MSPANNVDVVRTLSELWNNGVRSIPAEYIDPAVELESPFSSVAGEPYRGYEGIERWVLDVDEQFSKWQIDHDEVHEVEGAVLAVGRLHGRARASEIELDQPFALVCHFSEEHRLTRVRIYTDLVAARKAVGLS